MEGGNNAEISVNKMFEEYVYAYIQYAILDANLAQREASRQQHPPRSLADEYAWSR
jgi:hypothetical protein